MRRRYKIGEIVSSTGITSHALKYYEEQGVLQPLVDEQTGYRYYDVRGIGRIISIHRLRQFGFSLKDIRDLLRGVDEARSWELYKAQVAANEAEIARLQRANTLLKARMGVVERFCTTPRAWEVRTIPPFRFIEHWRADDDSEQLFSVAEQIEDSVETFNTVWMPAGEREEGFTGIWGLLRFDREGEPLPPRWEQCSNVFPGGPCLVRYVGDSTQPIKEVPKSMEEAAEMGHSLTGDAFSLTLGWITGADGVRRNGQVLLFPLKNEETLLT